MGKIKVHLAIQKSFSILLITFTRNDICINKAVYLLIYAAVSTLSAL